MRKTWNWIKDNAGTITEMNGRFDAQDRRLQRLEDDVPKLHEVSDYVSRNEAPIALIRQQPQTADAPSP